MEKEAFVGSPAGLNWQMLSADAAAPKPGMSSGYLNINWEQTIDQSAQFESALSSLVSSPSSNTPAAGAGESVVIRELIGRLGNICNSGEISPPPSRYNSCYSTPLNSPPKLNLSMTGNPAAPACHLPFACDPCFGERAARFPSYGGSGHLSRVSSSQSLKALEESSASRGVPAGHGNGKKRKAVPKGKGKEASSSSTITAVANPPKTAGEDAIAKRSKDSEAVETDKGSIKPMPEEEEDAATKKKKKQEEESSKPPEPSKDYIHVRARRGQATDSHSLAERVRREKISERMKFLQDLVPGCNKVTGKAVMLDEIINYVQSLQRQVEFLSMKLAAVNQRLDLPVDNFFPKDLLPPQAVYPLETPSSSLSFGNATQGASTTANGLELPFPVSHSLQLPPIEGYFDSLSQLGALWDDDLHTVVQMGFSQAQENVFSSQSFQGYLPTNQMKIEL